MLRNFIFTTVLLILGFAACQGSVSCLDEGGREVDWWVIYKLPHDKDSKNELIRDGTGYFYIDSSSNSEFKISDKSINNSQSSAGHTLSQIYEKSSDRTGGYAMYNDEDPDKVTDFDRAHSKGLVAYDSSSGFWLVHSVPKYPPFAKSHYYYPESGTMYGQSMLCMSLSLAGINTAGKQFQMNGPHFYDYSMPESLESTLHDLYEATKYNRTINDTNSNTEILTSTGGNKFVSFAKSRNFGKDLYSALVGPTLKKSLFVESWVRGDEVDSCCSPKCPYDVYNVTSLDFGDEVKFTEHADHSKWAVAMDKSTLCIGDINRMTSQFHRGGGTVCFENSNVAGIYRNAVTAYSDCPHGDREKFPESAEININFNIRF